jgi:hypothetical protein
MSVNESEGSAMDRSNETTAQGLRAGDVVEITIRGERHTAEVMLVSEDEQLLLDLFDGDRPVFARASALVDVAVFRPETADFVVAA